MEPGAPKLAAMDIFAGCCGVSCGMHEGQRGRDKVGH